MARKDFKPILLVHGMNISNPVIISMTGTAIDIRTAYGPINSILEIPLRNRW